MESLAQLKAYSERMALKNALEVQAIKELQASGQTPDYGSMRAGHIGELLGSLGNDEWRRDVRSFANSPLYHKLGMSHKEFRDHIPDWILDRNTHPRNNPLNRGDITPLQQLKDALMRQLGQSHKN